MVSCCQQLQLEEELRNWERGAADMDTADSDRRVGASAGGTEHSGAWDGRVQKAAAEVRNAPVGHRVSSSLPFSCSRGSLDTGESPGLWQKTVFSGRRHGLAAENGLSCHMILTQG